MPALPPWLTPARPAPFYATGLGLGLRAAEQQTAAAQRAQQLAAQAAAQQNEAMLQAERMAVQQQIAQQEMGLKEQELGMSRQELAQREAMNQFKIDEASRLASAQSEFARRVASGEPAEQVLAEMGPMVGSDAAFAALIREQTRPDRVIKPPELATVGGKDVIWNPQSGAFQFVKDQPELTEYQRKNLIRQNQTDLNKLIESNARLLRKKPEELTQAEKDAMESMRSIKEEISSLKGMKPSSKTSTTSAAMNQNVLPFPKSKDQAITGQLYQTKLGIMEWNGTKFVAPSTSTQSDY